MARTNLNGLWLTRLPITPSQNNQLSTKMAEHDSALDATGVLTGLVGNGTTDDGPAIQVALDAAATAGGGLVLIPKGTYYIGNSLSVGSNTTVRGAGIGATVLRGKAGSYTGITVNGNVLYATIGAVAKNHVTIEHITVNQSTNGNTSNGISLIPDGAGFTGTYCTDCTIRNCEVLGYESHSYGIWSQRGRRIQIVNNFVDGGVTSLPSIYGQEGIEAFGGYDVVIHGNTVRRWGGAGINGGSAPVMDNAECVGITVTGNTVEACGQGIHFGTSWDVASGAQDITGLVIANNTIRSCGTEGIYINTPYAGTTLRNIVVEGNSIDGGPSGIKFYGLSGETHYGIAISGNAVNGATTTTLGAITLIQVSGARVTGNTVASSSGIAFYLVTVASSALTGNSVQVCQKQAVLASGCTDLSVAGNRFTGYNAGGSVGGLLSTTSVRVVVKDNEWSQTAAGASTDVIVTGTSGVVTGNIPLVTGSTDPFTNTCTNTNFGTATVTASATTVDVTSTWVKGTLPHVQQSAGTIRPFSLAFISGGFRITVNAAATGNESFAWRLA